MSTTYSALGITYVHSHFGKLRPANGEYISLSLTETIPHPPCLNPSLPFSIADSTYSQLILLQLIQMLQPAQNNLLARLFNLPCQEHLV